MNGLVAVAAAVVFAGVVVAPPGPASAHTTTCVGTGAALLTSGLSYPVGPASTRDYHLTMSGFGHMGTCAGLTPTLSSLAASGTLTGWCGHWVSSAGTLSDGDHTTSVSLVKAGSVVLVTAGGLTLTPGVQMPSGGIGLVNAVPLPTISGTGTLGNSCSSGTASFFALVGVVHLNGA